MDTAPASPVPPSTGLLTDRYELTMLHGALRSGVAQRRSVFEVFARYLPYGRRYGVVAGVGRLLEALSAFRFDADQLDFVRSAGIADEVTLDFLKSYRFSGSIWGYAEGDCYFPGSPILVVEGTFAEAVILETLALSILNHDCAIAAAGSRMLLAAAGRPLIEMGSRRTHEQAGVAAARAAYIAGFATTSNLQAGHQYAIPTSGTSAHSFTLVHDDERQAFAAQLDALGPATTLLVDTYDVATAVAAAIEVAGLQVRRGGEAGDVGGPGAGHRGALVGPPRAHFDQRPVAGRRHHPGRGGRDRAVVVQDGQGDGFQQDRLGEGAFYDEDR